MGITFAVVVHTERSKRCSEGPAAMAPFANYTTRPLAHCHYLLQCCFSSLFLSLCPRTSARLLAGVALTVDLLPSYVARLLATLRLHVESVLIRTLALPPYAQTDVS